MNVFISWSGEKSNKLASALKDMLSDSIQSVRVFMSSHDIEAGSRWGSVISQQLSDCNFGIICVNPENKTEPWILFEAGCLGKSVEESKVVPYLMEMKTTDITFPLAQFQSLEANREGTLKLFKSINAAIETHRLQDDQVARIFERFWPDLEKKIEEISSETKEKESIRSDREIMEETLKIVRKLDREIQRLPSIILGEPDVTTKTVPKPDITTALDIVEGIDESTKSSGHSVDALFEEKGGN